MSSGTYRTVLRAPGAPAFFIAATVGRAGIAMTSLGIVWLVHGWTGSYGTAGLVTGVFAVAEGVTGPQTARLIDRIGQTRVLPPLLVAHAGAVAALVVSVVAHGPTWTMALGGVLMGATIPQLGALSAARWSALLGAEQADLLPTAFSLESLANAVSYLFGPSVVGTIGATGHTSLGTVLAAGLVVGGGLAFASQRRTAPRPASHASERRHAGSSLLSPGFGLLVAVNLSIGGYFSAMQVSIPAFAVEHHAAYTAAFFSMTSNVSSLLAGWVYGLRRWPAAFRVQLAIATGGLAVGATVYLAVGPPLLLGLGVALTGLAVPVILVLCSALARSMVRPAVLTQAFTWLNSASAAGFAGMASIAGRTIDAHGAHGGLVAAAVAAALLAVIGVLGLRLMATATDA